MKNYILTTISLFLLATRFQPALGQLALTGTNYVQNFNAIAGGLPPGWSVRTNAGATRLGDIATNYNGTGKTWGDTTGEFGNCASTVNNSGTNFLGAESTTIQAACTNRALAIRQTGSFGDPGAAFTLQVSNTIGVSNIIWSLDVELLRANANSTTWTMQYAVGNSPNSFVTLGTFPDPGSFGTTQAVYSLGAEASNQASNLWLRVAALTAATTSGTRDTFAIDNVSLSWTTNAPAITRPCLAGICFNNGTAQINFTGNSSDSPGAFIVQTADQISGPYVDVTGMTIAQTSPGIFRAVVASTNLQQFYRIKRP